MMCLNVLAEGRHKFYSHNPDEKSGEDPARRFYAGRRRNRASEQVGNCLRLKTWATKIA